MPSPRFKRQQQRAARDKRRGMQSSRAIQPSPNGPSDNAVVGGGSSAPAFPSSPPRHHNKARRNSGQSDGSPCGSTQYSPTLCEQKVDLRRRSSLVPLGAAEPPASSHTSVSTTTRAKEGNTAMWTPAVVGVVDSQFKAFRESSIPCDEVVDDLVSTVSTGSSDEDEVVILESCGRGSLAGFGSQLASGFGRFPSNVGKTGTGGGLLNNNNNPPPSSGATSRTHSTVLSSGAATPRRVSFSTVIDDGEFIDDLENDVGSDDNNTLFQTARSTKLTEELLATLKSVSHSTAAATRSTRRRSSGVKPSQVPTYQHGDRRRRMSGRNSSGSGMMLEGTSPRQPGQQQQDQVVCRTQSSDHPPRIGTAASKTRLPFQQLSPRRLSNPFPSTARSACAKPTDPTARPKPTLISGYNNGLSRKSSNPLIIDCPSGRFSGGPATSNAENLPPHSGRAMHDVFI